MCRIVIPLLMTIHYSIHCPDHEVIIDKTQKCLSLVYWSIKIKTFWIQSFPWKPVIVRDIWSDAELSIAELMKLLRKMIVSIYESIWYIILYYDLDSIQRRMNENWMWLVERLKMLLLLAWTDVVGHPLKILYRKEIQALSSCQFFWHLRSYYLLYYQTK